MARAPTPTGWMFDSPQIVDNMAGLFCIFVAWPAIEVGRTANDLENQARKVECVEGGAELSSTEAPQIHAARR